MYDSPKFKVTAAGISSVYRTQESGIRQGCPLSPYLFVLLMSALFVDIEAQLSTPKQQDKNQLGVFDLLKFYMLIIHLLWDPHSFR